MNFQLVNVNCPNSIGNTCVFTAFQATDSITNLHVALDRYRDQLTEVQETKWRLESTTVLSLIFMFALKSVKKRSESSCVGTTSRIYGITGATGMFTKFLTRPPFESKHM